MELGETTSEGAARETTEEAGAQFQMGPLFTVMSVARVGQVHLYFLAELVPHLSLAVRRLRDAGKDWQWIFVGITGIGSLWLLYLHTLPSAPLLRAG